MKILTLRLNSIAERKLKHSGTHGIDIHVIFVSVNIFRVEFYSCNDYLCAIEVVTIDLQSCLCQWEDKCGRVFPSSMHRVLSFVEVDDGAV